MGGVDQDFANFVAQSSPNASQLHMMQAPITGSGMIDARSVDVVDVAGNAALGKALANDTMAAFVAAHPNTEQG